MESRKILCDLCGASFSNNQNLLRHVREKHQGMKRTEKRKRDVTDNEVISQASPAEESTEVSKPANTRFKNHMKTRLKELANRYGLSHTYDSRNIKDAIVEKFNQPT